MNALKNNQRGFSLVEVLLSVSILAFISLSVMGYFIQSVESSTEDSRRIVAIKLAKKKVEQIRNAWENEYLELSKLSIFAPISLENTPNSIKLTNQLFSKVDSNSNSDIAILRQVAGQIITSPDLQINEVDYRYVIELSNAQQNAFSENYNRLTQGSAVITPKEYLMKFRVTVYWGDEQDDATNISAKRSTYLDSYLVFRR
jgi:prepilin-type N-terminal cleavage/methylation domain-containing protein